MNLPFKLLLGRKTFEIWAPYWPQHVQRSFEELPGRLCPRATVSSQAGAASQTEEAKPCRGH